MSSTSLLHDKIICCNADIYLMLVLYENVIKKYCIILLIHRMINEVNLILQTFNFKFDDMCNKLYLLFSNDFTSHIILTVLLTCSFEPVKPSLLKILFIIKFKNIQ